MNYAFLIVVMFVAVSEAAAQPFEIEQPTIAGGGGEVSGGGYTLRGVVNPQAGGRLQGGAFTLTGGLFPLDRPDSGCLADTNGDGQLSPGDFNAWILAFNSQSPACDQNGDGQCNPGDFNAWVLNYNAGCT